MRKKKVFFLSALADKLSCFVVLRYLDEFTLTEGYCARHFLVGLLLQEISYSLREPRDYRRRSIALLRNVLAKHTNDKRYSDLVILFLPFSEK